MILFVTTFVISDISKAEASLEDILRNDILKRRLTGDLPEVCPDLDGGHIMMGFDENRDMMATISDDSCEALLERSEVVCDASTRQTRTSNNQRRANRDYGAAGTFFQRLADPEESPATAN